MRKEPYPMASTSMPMQMTPSVPVDEEQVKAELERRNRMNAEYESQSMMRDEIQHHRLNAHHNLARLFDQAVQELNSMARPALDTDAHATEQYYAALGRVQVLAGVLKDLGGPY